MSEAEAGHVRGLAVEAGQNQVDRVCSFECQVLEGLRSGEGSDASDPKLALLPPTFSEVLASLNPEPLRISY